MKLKLVYNLKQTLNSQHAKVKLNALITKLFAHVQI